MDFAKMSFSALLQGKGVFLRSARDVVVCQCGLLLYTEFLIEYYEYSFDYLITITNQFTINAHT